MKHSGFANYYFLNQILNKPNKNQAQLIVLNEDLVLKSRSKLTSSKYSERIMECKIHDGNLYVLLQVQKCRNCDIYSKIISIDLKSNRNNKSETKITSKNLKSRA